MSTGGKGFNKRIRTAVGIIAAVMVVASGSGALADGRGITAAGQHPAADVTISDPAPYARCYSMIRLLSAEGIRSGGREGLPITVIADMSSRYCPHDVSPDIVETVWSDGYQDRLVVALRKLSRYQSRDESSGSRRAARMAWLDAADRQAPTDRLQGELDIVERYEREVRDLVRTGTPAQVAEAATDEICGADCYCLARSRLTASKVSMVGAPSEHEVFEERSRVCPGWGFQDARAGSPVVR